MRNQKGFTLIEVMITLAVLFLMMNAVFTFFLGTISQYKRESKIVETGVETIVGLEILRKDVESAGYGLPWTNLPGYTEPPGPANTSDSPNAPRGVINSDSSTGPDRLVIKAVSIGEDDACRKWTTLQEGPLLRPWGEASMDLQSANWVVVIDPGTTPMNARQYIGMTTYANAGDLAPDSTSVRVVYGLANTTPMASPPAPFNRAEFMIDTSSVPQLCAPGTGLLVKRVVDSYGTTLGPPLPLLDCVKDFQVSFGINLTGTGSNVDNVTADLTGYTARDVREKVRDIRVSILAQDGRRDDKFRYPLPTVNVGKSELNASVGRTVDVSAYRNYRWKVHNLVVRPTSLR